MDTLRFGFYLSLRCYLHLRLPFYRSGVIWPFFPTLHFTCFVRLVWFIAVPLVCVVSASLTVKQLRPTKGSQSTKSLTGLQTSSDT